MCDMKNPNTAIYKNTSKCSKRRINIKKRISKSLWRVECLLYLHLSADFSDFLFSWNFWGSLKTVPHWHNKLFHSSQWNELQLLVTLVWTLVGKIELKKQDLDSYLEHDILFIKFKNNKKRSNILLRWMNKKKHRKQNKGMGHYDRWKW